MRLPLLSVDSDSDRTPTPPTPEYMEDIDYMENLDKMETTDYMERTGNVYRVVFILSLQPQNLHSYCEILPESNQVCCDIEVGTLLLKMNFFVPSIFLHFISLCGECSD